MKMPTKTMMIPALAALLCAPCAGHAQTTNATNGVDLLSGYLRYWTPGQAWNTGTPTTLGQQVLPLNLGEVAVTALLRNHDAEIAAYYDDRRNQSYSVIDGFGPLTAGYLAGSGAVTTIPVFDASTSTVSYVDNGNGAGATTAPLGVIAQLVNAVRNNSSTTPAKNYFLYPRPWRQSLYGYDLGFVVAPSLVPEESPTPATDSGFPSGHTNAAFLTAYAMAYAVPERFQELLTRASELGTHRIVAGMHSPLDVIGGRDLATFKTIANLADPANAALKLQARATALSYLAQHCPASIALCAHPTTDAYTPNRLATQAEIDQVLSQVLQSPPPAPCANTLGVCTPGDVRSDDWFADRTANAINWHFRLTYGFPAVEDTTMPAVVPASAEVLLETRLPYLSADQRREVLRTTEIVSGSPLLDDAAGYGRLDLFRAADGYGRFDSTVTVTMQAGQGGFATLDAWRNDIDGAGGLVKTGSGTLVLAGQNSFSGGIDLQGGTLAATGRTGFGHGAVHVEGGTLQVAASSPVLIAGDLDVARAGTVELGAGHVAAVSPLVVRGAATVHGQLVVTLPKGVGTGVLTLLRSGSRTGRFDGVQIYGVPDGMTARVIYRGDAVLLRLEAA